MIVSELEAESTKKADVNIKIYRTGKEFEQFLTNSLKSIENVGINFNGILHKDFLKIKKTFPKKKFIDSSEAFVKSRIIKDESEIKLMRKAAKISDKVMKKIPGLVHKDMYEYELAAEINYLMQKNGAEKPAFDTISSFSKNTAEPHYTNGDAKLKNGDFVLCDFGACFKKYNSDITRTFVFGKASKKQKEMYETVLEAQRIGFERIKTNIEAHAVHDAVNNYIERTKYKGRFIHSTGHSLGIDVHDEGVGFNPECKVKLKENMILTVEPGVYIPGFGGVRIEDDVLIKKDGIDILTKSSKEFIEI